MRRVLLIEPNYKNKYPPIGLMKLATYHRSLNDYVRFYKGDLRNFIINEIYSDLLDKLKSIEKGITWEKYYPDLIQYIKKGTISILEEMIALSQNNKPLIRQWLKYYSKYYRTGEYKKHPKWDRVCITTLFTFHWKITIETINYAKYFVKNINELKLGGILASILHDEVYNETGIKSYRGLLDKPGLLDNNNIIIDHLPLDYSILDEIEYKYPENNAYYSYMTRGCIRKCNFCVVWKLEPNFKDYIPLGDTIHNTSDFYGKKRNLLLLDNNVLASKKFKDIITEIKKNGFFKGATFTEPDHFAILIKNLKGNYNNYANIRKANEIFNMLLKKAQGKDKQLIYNLLEANDLLYLYTTTKDKILYVANELHEFYEKYRNKVPKLRYVDFNQGLDARLLTEEKMRLLSEIPIKPLRIAFDNMSYLEVYDRAVRLAAKYGISELSNYLLYNYNDKPEELYQRLSINVDLCEELNINIYSFPMKYLPIDEDKYYMNRNYIGKHWNKKFIRSIQAILNSTKGKVGRGKEFFKKAFGKDETEYFKLLYMPETYIIYRLLFERLGYTAEWEELLFKKLSTEERNVAIKIIKKNDFNNINSKTINTNVRKVLLHYCISRDDVKNTGYDSNEIKKIYADYESKVINYG